MTLEKDLLILKSEILNVIKGKSKFTDELLNEQIKVLTKKLNIANNELEDLVILIEHSQQEVNEFKMLGDTIPVWSEEFESTDIETKKMLLTKIIERIDVGNNEIYVKLNIKLEEFLNNMNLACKKDVQNVKHHDSCIIRRC